MRMGYADSIEIMNLMGEEYVNKNKYTFVLLARKQKNRKYRL